MALIYEKQIKVVLEKEITNYSEEAQKKDFELKYSKAKSTIIQLYSVLQITERRI